MQKLVIANLVHRPLRSLISVFAVAIEVVMIISIAAIILGILNGNRAQTSGMGWDIITRPGEATVLMNTSSASASVKVADVLRTLPHVQVAAPAFIKLTLGSSIENIFGIDYASYDALRPFVFLEGHPFQGPYDVIIDDLQASGKHLKIGDQTKVLGHMFTVCGIVEHGKGARVFIPLTTAGDLEGTPGKATAFYLKTEDAPKYQAEVQREINATDGLGQYSSQTLDDFLSSLTPDKIPGVNIALKVVVGIATVIGFLVIFQSMYTAVMERTREIGILKSMGASQWTIVGIVLRESGVLALTGTALGVGFTYLLRSVLHAKFPTLSFTVTRDWVELGVVIAMSGSLLGGLYPALKAARKDPIEALSYE